MSDPIPGIYRHHKGGLYRLLHVARLREPRSEECAVYESIETGIVWVRPLRRPLLEGDDCWLDDVRWPDGVVRPRFMLVADTSPKTDPRDEALRAAEDVIDKIREVIDYHPLIGDLPAALAKLAAIRAALKEGAK